MSSSSLVGRLRVIMGLDDARFRKGLGDAATGARKLAQDMQRIGGKISTRVTAPLLAAGTAATAAFVASANNLADLQRQADLAGLSVQDFKEAALTVEDYGIQQDKLADILKDVNDRLGDFRSTGAGPMADFFENIAPKVGLTIESFEGLSSSQALAKFVTALEDAGATQAEMTFYMEALASDATALIPAFRNGGAEIEKTARRARELGLALDEDLIRSARQTREDFRLVSDVMSLQFQQAMIGLAPAFTQLMTVLMPLLQTMIDAAGRLATFTARVAEVNPELLSWGAGITVAVAAIGPFIAGLGFMIQGIVAVGTTLTSVAALLLANPIGLAVTGIAAAATLIYLNWDSVGPWFRDLMDSIGQVAAGLLEVLRGIFTGDMGAVVTGLKKLWGGCKEYWRLIWEGIGGVLKSAWDNIIKPITDALGITDEITAAWEAVRNMFDRVLGGIADAFDAVWSRIEPVISKIEAGVSKAKALVNSVNGSRDGPISSGTYTGGATGPILPGQSTPGDMIDGVRVGTGAAGKQGVADAASYEEGWLDRMGIKSPSRVMMEIGRDIAAGVAQGVLGGQPAVTAATDQVGGGIADTIMSYFGNITQNASSLSDVWDNIKSGFANMLSDMANRLFSSGLSSILGGVFGGMDPLAGALRGAGLSAIPAFAKGTPHFAGGIARVNERGGEILDLPRGTRVIPHDISRRMADQGASVTRVEVVPSPYFDARVTEISGQEAGRVVAKAAPGIQRAAVQQTVQANRRTKSMLG